jgi:GxxExxY protein
VKRLHESSAQRSKFTIFSATDFLKRSISAPFRSASSDAGSSAETETSVKVLYKNAVVGEYYADLFVDGCVIVEIKVAKCYHAPEEAQLLNQLKATGTKIGVLVNFGRERVEYKCMIS